MRRAELGDRAVKHVEVVEEVDRWRASEMELPYACKACSAHRAPPATRSNPRHRGAAPRAVGSLSPASALSRVQSQGAVCSYQCRLRVLSELILLRALRDILARLECARLAANHNNDEANSSSVIQTTTYSPKNVDMLGGMESGSEPSAWWTIQVRAD